MLGPLPRDQLGRGSHAHILACLGLTDGSLRGAPLRSGAASIGPQAAHDKAKAAIATRTLRALARIRLAPLAELGATAQRECVASDGDRACWPIRAHLRHADPLRHAALIGLSDCLCVQAEQCNGKPKSLLHNGVKSSPISAAGALWVRRPTET